MQKTNHIDGNIFSAKKDLPNFPSTSKAEKIQIIQKHFQAILQTLGLDTDNESIKDTPKRVAHMYVEEFFSGLNPTNKPKLSLFENTSSYSGILLEKNVSVRSICEHHFLPILGRTHVAYIPQKKIIGLSKINRLVNYCASQPQVQERLTMQILQEMQSALGIQDVAVRVDATHLCVTLRGIKDQHSSTTTTEYSGKFLQKEYRKEFLYLIGQNSETALQPNQNVINETG